MRHASRCASGVPLLSFALTVWLSGPAWGAPAPFSERGGLALKPFAPLSGPVVDQRKSLAVTDSAITSLFTLTDLLTQLANQAGTGQTATNLYRQLWDTQNPTGQGDLPAGQHCGASLPNGSPYPCRPAEGQQAAPGQSPSAFIALGLYNRFDLAATDGSDCGEYRIVFGRAQGSPREFLIFEAALPNPQPALGLAGCRPVTDFWAGLSQDPSVSSRGAKLKSFYFTGLPGFGPVFDLRNYGAGPLGRGQVRANLFVQPPWFLREFKTSCSGSPCTLLFQPATVKTNPFGDLFRAGSTDPRAASFQAFFPTQVPALAVADLNRFNYAVPDTFNAGGSDAQSFGVPDDYVTTFASNAPLRAAVQSQLTAIGSALTPDDVVARAQALSCGGCHQRSSGAGLGQGLTFPSSAFFVHSTESTETGPDGTRFVISQALTGTFLPFRAQVLTSFIGGDDAAIDPLGGLLSAGMNASITVHNTGTSTWTGFAGYSLAVTGAFNAVLPLGSTDVVGPGQSKTFTVQIPASYPATPMHVSMVFKGVPFGAAADTTLQCAPAAPSLSGAFSLGVTQLSWTSVSGATGYTLYRLAGSVWTAIFTASASSSGSSTSYTDPGLAPGTYSYEVMALGCSFGNTSNLASVCVPKSLSQACGTQCGVSVSDGCGGTLTCKDCLCPKVACSPKYCPGVCDRCLGCVQ